ncbi:MAG: hypothetical protein AB7S70_05545 [Hyphomicrobium sp.]|uniref:hypothetical protein n=1 Tax=Hyphomicrobium sp. TaxID=82 RepID=UPI003D0BA9FD
MRRRDHLEALTGAIAAIALSAATAKAVDSCRVGEDVALTGVLANNYDPDFGYLVRDGTTSPCSINNIRVDHEIEGCKSGSTFIVKGVPQNASGNAGTMLELRNVERFMCAQ